MSCLGTLLTRLIGDRPPSGFDGLLDVLGRVEPDRGTTSGFDGSKGELRERTSILVGTEERAGRISSNEAPARRVCLLGAALAVLLVGVAMAAPQVRASRVDHAIDGDTRALVGGERVRIVGIDTPERDECGYLAAKAKLASLARGTIVLKRSKLSDDQDRFGRLLRYVHDRAIDVGRRMISLGYAEHYDRFRHDRLRSYEISERSARTKKRGLWKSCGTP
jgi:endonuclease YncB( thermonuclease family)